VHIRIDHRFFYIYIPERRTIYYVSPKRMLLLRGMAMGMNTLQLLAEFCYPDQQFPITEEQLLGVKKWIYMLNTTLGLKRHETAFTVVDGNVLIRAEITIDDAKAVANRTLLEPVRIPGVKHVKLKNEYKNNFEGR